MTPRYPEDVLAGGRLERGRALVFPNLFPLAALHAVVTYPERHFLRPSEFEPALLRRGSAPRSSSPVAPRRAYTDLEHLELCCNHMLPAGASMVHAHFQVFGGPAAPWLLRLQWERAAAFYKEHGVSYWQALVDEETARGERVVGGRAGCTWLAAYAPSGGREVMAVLPGRARLAALDDDQVSGARPRSVEGARLVRARGPFGVQLLAVRRAARAASAEAHAVVLRVVARSAFKPDYRTDDYFLQKQLGGELIFVAPEQIAATLRPEFGAA